jgi:hypothetical protein
MNILQTQPEQALLGAGSSITPLPSLDSHQLRQGIAELFGKEHRLKSRALDL